MLLLLLCRQFHLLPFASLVMQRWRAGRVARASAGFVVSGLVTSALAPRRGDRTTEPASTELTPPGRGAAVGWLTVEALVTRFVAMLAGAGAGLVLLASTDAELGGSSVATGSGGPGIWTAGGHSACSLAEAASCAAVGLGRLV
jgi:hypothetical protein